MPLPLPNLDTRRFSDLMADAYALIPRYAPGWTDYNETDPGITLAELLAWLVEHDIYRANRVPDRHRLKFLELAGVLPAPPQSASTVLSLSAPSDVLIRGGTTFTATTTVGPVGPSAPKSELPFTSTNPVHVTQLALTAVQSWDGEMFQDATSLWQAGLAVPAWGADPTGFGGSEPPALLLGFADPLPTHALSLWLGVQCGDDPDERALMQQEVAAAAQACAPLRPRAVCNGATTGPQPLPRCACQGDCPSTIWEICDGGAWHPVQADDATEGLLLDGLVRLRASVGGSKAQVGAVPEQLHWLRCRAAGGAPDMPPAIDCIAVNAAVVEQRVPVSSTLKLAAGASLPMPPLSVGDRARLTFQFNADDEVTRVQRTTVRAVPKVRVLDVTPNSLELTLARAGNGLGTPNLSLQLPAAAVSDGEITVWSDEDAWMAQPDLTAALPRDRVLVLDPQKGVLSFGDGERGLAPRAETTLLACYDVTAAAGGNLPANGTAASTAAGANTTTWTCADFPTLAVTQCEAASGGTDAEDLPHAAARAAAILWAHERLVELAGTATTLDLLGRDVITALPAPPRATTLLDFERLALSVPGTRVERVRAWSGIDPATPGLEAPGTVAVVVLNSLPPDRPEPTQCLLDRIERYLRRRKTLGTRVVVSGPDYVEVTVTAMLAPLPGSDPAALTARALTALSTFVQPLNWPFGRHVFRSEILALLHDVSGVDAVTSLELTAGGNQPSCGNLCIGPTQLPYSGAHSVTVGS